MRRFVKTKTSTTSPPPPPGAQKKKRTTETKTKMQFDQWNGKKRLYNTISKCILNKVRDCNEKSHVTLQLKLKEIY